MGLLMKLFVSACIGGFFYAVSLLSGNTSGTALGVGIGTFLMAFIISLLAKTSGMKNLTAWFEKVREKERKMGYD